MIGAKNNKIKKTFITLTILLGLLLGISVAELYNIQTKAQPPQSWICTSKTSLNYNTEKNYTQLNIFNPNFISICRTNNSTHSMNPLIGDKTKLLLINATPKYIEQLKVGDVIVYYNGVDYIIHRIVSIDNSTGTKEFRTKGDSNLFRDFFVVRPKDISQILVGILY